MLKGVTLGVQSSVSCAKSGHAPAAQCLCVLDPVPELGQSEPITDGQWSSQGALASDQHDVPSHPHTDPGDITTLAV